MISVTTFITIYLYKDRIYNLFNSYSSLQEYLKDFELSSARVLDIIDGDKYERESFGNKIIKKIRGDFEFRHVKFSYKNNMPVLKDLSFKVDANTTVAFVGKSGSGKTTIFNLLAKLYDINGGEILIDGENINDLSEDVMTKFNEFNTSVSAFLK